MQHFMLYKIAAGSLITGLFVVFMVIVTTAILTQNGFASQVLHQYSIQLVAEQKNPWALPQKSEKFLVPQHRPGFRGQAKVHPDAHRFHYGQMGQFITPEHLESLRQKQKRIQMMPPMTPHMTPGGRQYKPLMQRRLPPAQVMPEQMWPLLPGSGFGGHPGSLPWMPDETLDSLPPIYSPYFNPFPWR